MNKMFNLACWNILGFKIEKLKNEYFYEINLKNEYFYEKAIASHGTKINHKKVEDQVASLYM